MREPEFEQALEEAIRKAVESALKAYEAPAHNDGENATRGESVLSLPSIQRRAENEEIAGLPRRVYEDAGPRNRKEELPSKAAHERARSNPFPHGHGADAPHALAPRAQDGGAYHAAIRQHAIEPDRLFESLVPYCNREQRTSAATQTIPPRQDHNTEGRGLHAAIEQLRQDMNRNHGEAANTAMRKNHSRP